MPRALEWGKCEEVNKSVQTLSYIIIKPEDLMFNMITIVDNTVV